MDALARAGVEANLAWLKQRHGSRIGPVIADVREHKIEILAGAMDRRDTLRGERTPVRKAPSLRVSTPVTPLPVSPAGSASSPTALKF